MTTTLPSPTLTRSNELDRMSAIEDKLDRMLASIQALDTQVAFLISKAQDDRRRQDEWEDLGADLTPVIREAYGVAVEQLTEIQTDLQLEDLLALLKRLARSTRSIHALLDQVESMNDLIADVAPLTRDMFAEAVTVLSEFERKGYFGFFRQAQYMVDQIVTSFSEEDVRLLGDNIVMILNTVKALTQPEMMTLLNNLTQGYHEAETAEDLPTSLFGLLGQMRDPEVRRGLALSLIMLKRVSRQH